MPIAGEKEKKEAIQRFNDASKKITISKWDEIGKDSTIRNEIYTYYEYVQFKRARFDCTNVEYNQKTGRLVRMEFQFTGKFE